MKSVFAIGESEGLERATSFGMITQKAVEHIAKLARIEVTDKEKEKLAQEMSAILGYIEKLNEVNTEGVEPTAQITGLENVFRQDQARPGNQRPGNQLPATSYQLLISAMPKREGNYLKVKAVFETSKK